MKHKATAKEIFERAFHRITRKLSLSDKLTAEEQLENVLKEDRRQRFIDDILSIRRSGHYIPDYNKPKKHTDYQLVMIKEGVLTCISGNTYTKCERPQDFVGADGSLINAYGSWLANIQETHTKELEDKHLKELQKLDRENVMADYEEKILKKMFQIN